MNKNVYVNDKYHWYREGYPGPYSTGTKRGLGAPWEKIPEENLQKAKHEEKEEESELDDSLLLPDSEDFLLEESELDDSLLLPDSEDISLDDSELDDSVLDDDDD